MTECDYNTIVEVLEEVKRIYHFALELDYEERERIILQVMRINADKHEELHCVRDACDEVLTKWPKGQWPHDSSLIEQTKKLLEYPYKDVFPVHSFDREMLIYKWIICLVEASFKKIEEIEIDKGDKYIIERLKRIVDNTFIKNPNLQGSEPYYKYHSWEFSNSKKLWLELLDKDFDSYMDYFRGDE